jgi:hypothetical protein
MSCINPVSLLNRVSGRMHGFVGFFKLLSGSHTGIINRL